MCVSSQLLNSHSPLQRNVFLLEFFALLECYKRKKTNVISLGWIFSKGKFAELRKKVSLNLICRTWSLFTANCWLCLQRGWKRKWFIIIMPSRYDSHETKAKPIHKPAKKLHETTTEVFSSILLPHLLFWLLFFTGCSPGREGKGKINRGNAEREGH